MSSTSEELIRMVQDIQNGFTEPQDEDDPFDPLSVDLQRTIVVWITMGGPNIWVEIPVDSGSARIHGAWGSDRYSRSLSDEEEQSLLESIGIYDIEEYLQYHASN